MNGQQWDVASVVRFQYYADPVSVLRVVPPLGLITGGTTTVITGMNFTETQQIKCRFGRTRNSFFYTANLVRGYLGSEPGTIVCIAPDVQESCNLVQIRTNLSYDSILDYHPTPNLDYHLTSNPDYHPTLSLTTTLPLTLTTTSPLTLTTTLPYP